MSLLKSKKLKIEKVELITKVNWLKAAIADLKEPN